MVIGEILSVSGAEGRAGVVTDVPTDPTEPAPTDLLDFPPLPQQAGPGRRAGLLGMTESFGPYCGYRLDETLYWQCRQRPHVDVPFGQLHGLGCCQYRTRIRHLLHAGRQVNSLTDRGVLHVQVISDDADDDLS